MVVVCDVSDDDGGGVCVCVGVDGWGEGVFNIKFVAACVASLRDGLIVCVVVVVKVCD